MKTGKKVFALLTALALTVSLAACSNKDDEINCTLEEVLASYADNTNLDELMANGAAIELVSPEGEVEAPEETSFMEQVNELEAYISLSKRLENLGIKPATTSTEETSAKYADLSADEIELLIESLNDEGLTDVERARVKAGLSCILAENQEWIMSNGVKISEELLKRTIKAAACQVSGLEVEYYNSCKISARNQSKESDYIGTVEVYDPISGTTLNYEIASGNGAIAQAADVLYGIQVLEGDESYETVVDYCGQALDATKVAVAAGVKLEDDQIKSEKKVKDAKKLILEMDTTQATETQEG